MDCSAPGFPVLHYLLELAQTHVHWVGDAIQPSHPLSPLLLLPLIFPGIRVFSNESALLIRWPKYWSFSFSISPSNEYSVLISFRIDWVDVFAVPGTLKSLLQHHSSKALILQYSDFFMKVQLSHPYMTTGKTTALTIWTLVAKWCLCFLIRCLGLSEVFFQRASFNFMAAVTICSDFGAQENKVCHCFLCFPIYLPWCNGTGCHDPSFLCVSYIAGRFFAHWPTGEAHERFSFPLINNNLLVFR